MKTGFNDIYLNLNLRKSKHDKTDEFGNPFFEVEASNENIDLQNQIVLQRALLKSKKNFLEHGFISYDHLYKTKDEYGVTVSNPEYLIGEPVDVYTEGRKTIVKGKLYKTNPYAADIISKLQDGSTRIRASVGGLWPKIEKDKSGVERIYEVLWNDLALTPTPVNNTVGAATLVKSMNPDEFIKSLSAGHGTDSSKFKNGRALIHEDLSNSITDVTAAKADVLAAIENGEIEKTKEDIAEYLVSNGIKGEQARKVIREIIKEESTIMKKSKFADEVEEILKSLDSDDKKKDDDIELELDEDELIDPDFDDDEDDDKKMKKGCKKSLDDDSVDATEVLKSLLDTLDEQNERISNLEKSLDDVGKSVVKVAKITKSFGEKTTGPRSVMNKSVDTGDTPTGQITQEDFEQAQEVLMKSVQNDEISILDSTKMESEIQRAKAGLCQLSAKTYNFISSKINQ